MSQINATALSHPDAITAYPSVCWLLRPVGKPGFVIGKDPGRCGEPPCRPKLSGNLVENKKPEPSWRSRVGEGEDFR